MFAPRPRPTPREHGTEAHHSEAPKPTGTERGSSTLVTPSAQDPPPHRILPPAPPPPPALACGPQSCLAPRLLSLDGARGGAICHESSGFHRKTHRPESQILSGPSWGRPSAGCMRLERPCLHGSALPAPRPAQRTGPPASVSFGPNEQLCEGTAVSPAPRVTPTVLPQKPVYKGRLEG